MMPFLELRESNNFFGSSVLGMREPPAYSVANTQLASPLERSAVLEKADLNGLLQWLRHSTAKHFQGGGGEESPPATPDRGLPGLLDALRHGCEEPKAAMSACVALAIPGAGSQSLYEGAARVAETEGVEGATPGHYHSLRMAPLVWPPGRAHRMGPLEFAPSRPNWPIRAPCYLLSVREPAERLRSAWRFAEQWARKYWEAYRTLPSARRGRSPGDRTQSHGSHLRPKSCRSLPLPAAPCCSLPLPAPTPSPLPAQASELVACPRASHGRWWSLRGRV
jgi:hypothetical protein